MFSIRESETRRRALLDSPDENPAEVLEHWCMLTEGGGETCRDHAE